MTAYVILDIEITDPALFEEYKKIAPASIAAFGGKYLARGGATETLEGSWYPKRLVILEFDSVPKARAWLESNEYKNARDLRQKTSRTQLIVVEGAPT
jgi:uncharacterized protein (DUF1330 family)